MKFIQYVQNGLKDIIEFNDRTVHSVCILFSALQCYILFKLFWWEIYPQKPYTQDPWRGPRQKKSHLHQQL